MKNFKKKNLRLPNGFGSIVLRTDGQRRNPYMIRKWIGGRQKIIGSAPTYEAALTFLVDYNKDPALLDPDKMTFSQVYDLVAAERFTKLAKNTVANYTAAYKHCSPLYDKVFAKLTIADLQAIVVAMGDIGVGYASQKKLRQLFHHMYTYARKYSIVGQTVDVAQFIDIDKKVIVYQKKPFNTRQLNRVKAIADDTDNLLAPWAMAVVMLIYGGPRCGEFIKVCKSDVKLKQRYYIIRDSKTAAGRNRAVPIHRKVLPYFRYWMERPGKTLIATTDGKPLTYHTFRTQFDKVMTASKCHHTPHECRHTCATWLDNAGANDTAIKRILGHASQGVTKGVYTHKSLHELKRAIDLLP